MGRTAELELIDSLLHRRDGVGPCLLLRGVPGVGKTALLDAADARAAADGMQVLRASGVEFEAEIHFAALHQMLYPVREHVDGLAGHHRDALEQVFDLVPGPSPVPLVAAAVLALLASVAAERRVLVLVDDLPWIDEASATVLGFAARRIGYEPIAFLAAARTRVASFFDHVNLPERMIGSLAAQPAAEVLDNHWPALAPAVRRRLLAEADGNPLVLRELPAALTDRQRSGQDLLPKLLPVSGRLEATFAHAFEKLPASTRKAILLAALHGSASLSTIEAAPQGRARVVDSERNAPNQGGSTDAATSSMSMALDQPGDNGAGEVPQGRRGQIPDTRTTSAEHVDNRAAANAGADPALAHYALTILDLGNGRYPEALTRALEVFHEDPPELGTQILPDLIEAAVRSGEMDAAASALERLSERTRSSGARLASGLLARSKALLTDDADALYREAIEHLRQSDTDVDLARAHLLYGEWLRRRRRRRDAREQLRAAQELFDNVGFPAFAHRASVELRATSEAVRKRRGESGEGLTSQEAEIARLVTEGSSNRQVAAQLFISQNTVEYHLQKVFRKIGVSSRTQLARAMHDQSRGDEAPAAGHRVQSTQDPPSHPLRPF